MLHIAVPSTKGQDIIFALLTCGDVVHYRAAADAMSYEPMMPMTFTITPATPTLSPRFALMPPFQRRRRPPGLSAASHIRRESSFHTTLRQPSRRQHERHASRHAILPFHHFIIVACRHATFTEHYTPPISRHYAAHLPPSPPKEASREQPEHDAITPPRRHADKCLECL